MGIEDISIISLDNEEFGGEIFEKLKGKSIKRLNRFKICSQTCARIINFSSSY